MQASSSQQHELHGPGFAKMRARCASAVHATQALCSILLSQTS